MSLIFSFREDLLNFLLACTDQPMGGRRVKKVPCHLSPDAAADIRRQVAMSLRQRKGDMSCFFFTDLMTFCLPSGRKIFFRFRRNERRSVSKTFCSNLRFTADDSRKIIR